MKTKKDGLEKELIELGNEMARTMAAMAEAYTA
jgi:hypothetical protein